MHRKLWIGLGCLLLSSIIVQAAGSARADEKPAPDEKAVARARKTAMMLDAVYKNTIVLITDKYVNSPKDYPAGRAAVVLFKRISKTGTHEVRLIDLTGEPSNPLNVAKDAFEKKAGKAILAGKLTFEEVADEKGKPYLRVMTSVPVVMKKCVMCHNNYKNVPEGKAIGALTYKIPID